MFVSPLFFFSFASLFPLASVVAALEKLGEYERTNSTTQCILTYFVVFFSRHNSHPSFEWNETLPISNAQFITEYIYQDSSWAHYHNMYMSGESGAKHLVFVIQFWEKLVANPNFTKWNSNPYGCAHVDLNLIVSYAWI